MAGFRFRTALASGAAIIVEAIEALEIDVLFVDLFISSHDAPESDSGAMIWL
jgi:hypothetical protein